MPGEWSRRNPSEVAAPEPGELHLWRIRLDQGEMHGDGECGDALSPSEQLKASRFRIPSDGRRWARARGVVRSILGGYLGLEPAGVLFASGTHGKPRLANNNALQLCFNVSHSGSWAMLGIASGCELGVDVERLRPELDVTALARIALPIAAQEALAAAEGSSRTLQFFRAWTRHEAQLKCIGSGFRVPAVPREPKTIVEDVSIGPGYAAAVAVAVGPGTTVLHGSQWEWT